MYLPKKELEINCCCLLFVVVVVEYKSSFGEKNASGARKTVDLTLYKRNPTELSARPYRRDFKLHFSETNTLTEPNH